MLVMRFRQRVGELIALAQAASVAARRARLETLRKEKLASDPKALGGYGYKVFSQSDEDGIISEIFRRVGVTNRVFVEIGVSDGLQNNTLALLYEGWRGLWIEASSEHCRNIEAGFASALAAGQLKLINAFATPENVDALLLNSTHAPSIDLLSIDIDGNDSHVLESIRSVQPRVVVLEYNAKFGPSLGYCMQYDATYAWRKTDRFGASLKHFELQMRRRGFSCVGCNLVGTNAFFVRDDLLGEHFSSPFVSEQHFEPARYELANLPAGHPPERDTFQTRVS